MADKYNGRHTELQTNRTIDKESNRQTITEKKLLQTNRQTEKRTIHNVRLTDKIDNIQAE